MSYDLVALLGEFGTATMDQLRSLASERSVRTWIREGRLVRVHPGVLALPDRRGEWLVRAHAAILYTSGQLSHVTALALWGLILERPPCIHVSVGLRRGIRSAPELAVHRTTHLDRPYDIDGLPVSGLNCALLDSWSLLNRNAAEPGSAAVARAAVIDAVRSGRSSTQRLTQAMSAQPNLAGWSQLAELLNLIAGGCHSELEIWGVRHVLQVDGIPKPSQQHRVALPGTVIYLDAALPDVKLGIELDGAAYHGASEARERDIARDAALAGVGWQVLRFSYRRVTRDPEGCRRDIAAAYQRRLASG
ncbi:MAG: DUF559 domain-containing protein [Geodermatophilaceae bacterium]|nr:DUF559 domain-containing protein [Geodermatophilaceae bacterium]